MPDNVTKHLPHILLRGTTEPEPYTNPSRGGGGKFLLKSRDRKLHGEWLREQLSLIQEQAASLVEQRSAIGVRSDIGLSIQFESDPGYPLKVESLEDQRSGIEVMNVQEMGENEKTTFATVYVPEGKLKHFFKIIERYLNEIDKRSKKPKNKKLIESIANIKLASLKAFWADEKSFDDIALKEKIWWEVWLRTGESDEERTEILNTFREQSSKYQIQTTTQQIDFPERTVLLAYASKEQLLASIILLNCLAELHRARITADTFLRLPRKEQYDWVQNIRSRIVIPVDEAPAVCILDTGINRSHPLIEPALNVDDMHAYNPNWGVVDHDRHGTEMAGLSLYGDLIDVLNHNLPIELQHRIESAKILPPTGANSPELYGDVTKQAIARAEIKAPFRNRAICLAITTTEFRDRGQPSSWSAAIDQLCSGVEDDQGRLVLISGGNAGFDSVKDYPTINQLEGIHDPAQSWNAVTVGAYTEKDYIDTTNYPDWTLVAPKGGLCPTSTTSITWQKQWPFKPDIVLEGGNMGRNPGANSVDYIDSLQLLSTYWRPQDRYFASMGDTSAATALAARMAAMIQASYSNFWPETIRGLLIHSAAWTDEMLNGLKLWKEKKPAIANLLRIYGFGVPDLERARWSATNVLTLIVQDSLQPYIQNKNEIKTNELHLHPLPWPRDVLMQLGETEVEMRVTLSYFVEPSPGRRGWNKKFRYASHGLRFDTKAADETIDEFRRRINEIARKEIEDYDETSSDSPEWLLGPRLRVNGSIHSDYWHGTAVKLADKGCIAVYPVNGWWKERKHLKRWDRKARYSLIVTIKTPSEKIDIYTPVANVVLV